MYKDVCNSIIYHRKKPQNNLNIQAQLNYGIDLLKMTAATENVYNEFNNGMGEMFMTLC